MSIQVPAINVNSDTFLTLFTRVNNMIDILAGNAVTADLTSNGSPTSGNSFLNGTLGVITIGAGTLRGGNVQSTNTLVISSNTSLGNSTVNVVTTTLGTILISGSQVANSTQVGFTTAYLSSGLLTVGGATVNAQVNSTSLVFSGVQVANSTQVGLANAYIAPNFLFVGNSTVNVVINSTAFAFNGVVSTYQVGSPILTGLSGLSAVNGVVVQVGSNTFTKRTITGTTGEVGVTNGDGGAGNPTLGLPTSLIFTGKTVANGTFNTPTISGATITGGTVSSLATDVAISDGGTGASTAAAAFNNLKQQANTTYSGVSQFAPAATFWAGVSTTQSLVVSEVWNSAVEVGLTDAGTITVDMSTFFNAVVTLAGNRTLGSPSNAKVGQSGIIRIVQDATGSRTLSYGSSWKFAGAIAPTLTTTAGAIDLLFYQVVTSTFIFASLVKGVG